MNIDRNTENNNSENERFDYISIDGKNTEEFYKLVEGLCKVFYGDIMYFNNRDIANHVREEIDKKSEQLLKDYRDFYTNYRY